MKVKYKGFELEAIHGKALGGREQVYYSIVRLSDCRHMTDDFSDDEATLEMHIECLKKDVDCFLEHPSDFLHPRDLEEMLMAERDEARKLAAWLFQNCVAIGGLPKDQIRMMRKRYPYLKEFKGFYPGIN